MDVVLRRPFADEVEDYKEYKRLRQMHREQNAGVGNSRGEVAGSARVPPTDGAADIQRASEVSQVMDQPLSDSLPEAVFHAEMMRHRPHFGRSDSAVE